MIEITLKVTALQMIEIGKVMADTVATTTVDGVPISDYVAGATGPNANQINGDDLKLTVEDEVIPLTTDTSVAISGVTGPHADQVAADAFAAGTVVKVNDPITDETPPPPVTDVPMAKGINGQLIAWDARIHGSAKKTNADGTWRLKQGIDRTTLVPQVEAELLAVGKPAAEPDSDNIPPPPADTTVVVATTFVELLPLITVAKANGTLTDEKINEVCKELGLAQFGLIATKPDLIPQAVKLLGV